MYGLTWEKNISKHNRLKKQRELYSRYPIEESEARRLIDKFVSEHGVTRAPSVEERRMMWGMG